MSEMISGVVLRQDYEYLFNSSEKAFSDSQKQNSDSQKKIKSFSFGKFTKIREASFALSNEAFSKLIGILRLTSMWRSQTHRFLQL